MLMNLTSKKEKKIYKTVNLGKLHSFKWYEISLFRSEK